MFRIEKKIRLAQGIYFMEIAASKVAKSCQPGQFIIVKTEEKAERIPLTICDYNREKGTVGIIFQVVGASTKKMECYEEGDAFQDFVGPLGCPSELITEKKDALKNKEILFVAGGVGAAPIYPQVKWMQKHVHKMDCIIGARSRACLILEEQIRQYAKELYITTDDGSYGLHGNVNDQIELLLQQGKQYDAVVAIGPLVMMKYVAQLTKKHQIKTIVSMNPIMVDGTGMCGACRVTVDGQMKFACVDGPEFDGHAVDFEEALRRQKMYQTEEGRANLQAQQQNHTCKCSGGKP